MKFFHLSDLHLGKRLNEFSLMEDQKYILNEILAAVDREAPDGVLLAGDIYDKSVPSAEAVSLFDSFLVALAAKGTRVFLISGNHDSAERLSFGGRLMTDKGIYFSPVYDGNVEPITLTDAFGEVRVYLLPFVKPATVRRFFPEEEVESYTDAVRVAVESMGIDTSVRNILVTHQFVTGALRSDSEEISVGGSDNVDAAVFSSFDYVALGHIHGPQSCGNEKIRYCGSPLKYSFSEASHQKSITVAELSDKGSLTLRTLPLVPLRDLREIKGSYNQVADRNFYCELDREDYYRITLTDEEDVFDAVGRLRVIYPNLMKLDYDNCRTRAAASPALAEGGEALSPKELFARLFAFQNGREMTENEAQMLDDMIERTWGSL